MSSSVMFSKKRKRYGLGSSEESFEIERSADKRCKGYDVALQIIESRPELTMEVSIFCVLARKADALNKENLKFMWRVINSMFRCINMKVGVGPAEQHSDALKFLTIVWNHTIRTMPKSQVYDILRGPPDRNDTLTTRYPSRILFVAAETGNTRFVVELLRAYPDLKWTRNDDARTLFHIAVMNLRHGIHNLLYEMGSVEDQIALFKDKDGNTMLHLVGLTSMKMRMHMSGASLLMQRELLWFKEIEKMMPPAFRERKNKAGQTPYELFSNENQDLVSKGLDWMKDCMVVATLIVTVATLIVTVAFVVAFTVPGGYTQDHGLPVFIHDHTFLVFIIADAISLFSSSTSLLVFLCILTSRHGQRDFMYSLPRKLMIGLVTLFFSVAAMMVTFSASFFVLYNNGLKWVPILIATFSHSCPRICSSTISPPG